MEFRTLRYFLAVAREGNITAAANCLLDGVMARRFMSAPEMRAFAPPSGPLRAEESRQ